MSYKFLVVMCTVFVPINVNLPFSHHVRTYQSAKMECGTGREEKKQKVVAVVLSTPVLRSSS